MMLLAKCLPVIFGNTSPDARLMRNLIFPMLTVTIWVVAH